MPDATADDFDDLTDDPAVPEDPDDDGIDQDAIERELDAEFPPPVDRSREAGLASAALQVIAAVLCVLAPFRAVYTLRQGSISASFDGWGRYSLSSDQHSARYGIVLTIVAVVLVVAAASRLRDLPRDGDTDGSSLAQATAVAIAGSALLLGALGAIALNIESTVSNTDVINKANGGTPTQVDIGGLLWFTLAAWVVSAVALWAPWFEARRRR